MKKLILLVALFVSPVFAQEEEQEVQIEIETDGGVQVATSSDSNRTVIGFPDKSFFLFDGRADMIYCRINEDGNPRCEEVDIDD
mgnify:CR=1 FL=1